MNNWTKQNKYHSKKVVVDGITFDSKKEARRWSELLLLQRAGEINGLERQKKYILIPSQKINGKCVERECAYIADFVYNTKDGKTIVEDTKSKATQTPVYIVKRKLMLQVYGIQIKEV